MKPSIIVYKLGAVEKQEALIHISSTCHLVNIFRHSVSFHQPTINLSTDCLHRFSFEAFDSPWNTCFASIKHVHNFNNVTDILYLSFGWNSQCAMRRHWWARERARSWAFVCWHTLTNIAILACIVKNLCWFGAFVCYAIKYAKWNLCILYNGILNVYDVVVHKTCIVVVWKL